MPEVTHPTTDPAPATEIAELRLALVCYGGVSLAVYMHGVTKELHKLIVAARAVDRARATGDPTNPFLDPSRSEAAGSDSEAVYFNALMALDAAGHPLSVAIDIIGGTSAGGINGVVLAKALALNASQDSLRDLWIGEGDLRKLLRAPAFAGVAIQGAVAALITLATAWRHTSLLRSPVMSQNLLHALTSMDAADNQGRGGFTSLIPSLRRLQLFVTTTDQSGFDVAVPSGAGGLAQRDRAYAQVMEFRSANRTPDCQPAGLGAPVTAGLAFAARATSAFPAAFAPISRSRFLTEVRRQTDLPTGDFNRIFRYRYPADPIGGPAPVAPARPWWRRLQWWRHSPPDAERMFIDGGLLDNAPFDLVIDAIAREEAHHEVIRRLVYIEPDPAKSLTAAVEAYRRPSRSFAADLMAIKAPLTSHSFLTNLLALREMNARITEIGRIAELQRVEIEKAIVTRVGEVTASMMSDDPQAPMTFLHRLIVLEGAQNISNTFYAEAQSELSQTWRTYQRMKALGIADRIADAVIAAAALPPEALDANAIREAISAHMRARPEWNDGGEALALAVLKPFDTPYRERRFMFILDGINKLYGPDGPQRAEVDELKSTIWTELAKTQRAPENIATGLNLDDFITAAVEFASAPSNTPGARVLPPSLSALIDTLFDDYERGLQDLLPDDNTEIWTQFRDVVERAIAGSPDPSTLAAPLGGGWTENHFRSLAARYLGFSKWDGILYPIMALSRIPQLTPIPVSQFSPLEAQTLRMRAAHRPKLWGATLAHFGAFLKPGYREADYLFGRLDGADLIVRLLGETTGRSPDLDGVAATAMAAIHTAERPTLTRMPETSRQWLDACFSSDAS